MRPFTYESMREGKWLSVRAADGVTPVGLIAARLLGRNDPLRPPAATAAAYLVIVTVDAGYRRNGIATEMRRRLERDLVAAGVDVVVLDAIPPEGISQCEYGAALERAGYCRGTKATMTKKLGLIAKR